LLRQLLDRDVARRTAYADKIRCAWVLLLYCIIILFKLLCSVFCSLFSSSLTPRSHRWFASLDWERLVALQVDSPFVPSAKNETFCFTFEPEFHELVGSFVLLLFSVVCNLFFFSFFFS
jgi:hypothetical protein